MMKWTRTTNNQVLIILGKSKYISVLSLRITRMSRYFETISGGLLISKKSEIIMEKVPLRIKRMQIVRKRIKNDEIINFKNTKVRLSKMFINYLS